MRKLLAITMTGLCICCGCTPPVIVVDDPRLALRDDDHVLGDADAQVVVIEYGDLECPVCGRFAREVFPTVQADYIDTNRVRWVFRHLPLSEIHPHALRAAAASECAAEQDRFYDYIETLFDNQAALEDADLIDYATDLGLDAEAFTSCLSSNRHDERINSDREDVIDLGATGAPTFFINGQIARGFIDTADFSALLDAAAAPR